MTDARRELRRQLLRSRTLIAGTVILLFWVLCAIAPGLFATHDPSVPNPKFKWVHPFFDEGFVMGTDRLGRDVFSRVVNGAREIMIVAPAAVIIGTVIGVVLGLLMGYFGGPLDDVVSRVIDALMSLPVILVALLALTSLSGGRLTLVLLIG
ncbi:MAG: ABC transporter permease, partial [Actinomycetota bacterium]